MSQERTTSEHSLDEAPRPQSTTERLSVPEAPPSTPAPRRRMPGPLRWAILVGVLALALAGVLLLTRTPDPMSDPRPVGVVQGFAAAIEARDVSKMLSYIEPTVFRREIGPEVRAYVEHLQDARFENARYELIDSDGEVAHVRWTATMRYSFNLGDQTKSGQQPIDTTFELRMIEGSWYLHSAKLPQAR